ncbi:MAG TPA: cysteine desulfurase family protein, partial [Mycobacteriales bacterium]|nr:cysteine desulfurase family protein [Mycobacteriales bacterium]
HAASTPLLPEVAEALAESLRASTAAAGNASSLHASGRRARRTVEEARERLAAALGARPSEVVLTAGGTESDNLAVKGLFWARRAADPRRTRVLASAVEHHAVLDAVQWLGAHEGATVELLPVDVDGRVHPDALREALERDPSDVALVTVMWANNEIGTVQPVRELAEACAEHGVPFHTDAVQAVGALPVDWSACGADALSLTGHKLGGPLGAGALLLSRTAACEPLLHGGGQERDVRSGTLDAPGAAALALAVDLAVQRQEAQAVRLAALRDDLVRRVEAAVPDAVLNGPRPSAAGAARLPGNAHFGFPGCEGDSLLMLLDARGVEVSTGSACSAGVARPSHVLLATGADEAAARSSLRFSLGHTSTTDDVDALVEALPGVVERARRAGTLLPR